MTMLRALVRGRPGQVEHPGLNQGQEDREACDAPEGATRRWSHFLAGGSHLLQAVATIQSDNGHHNWIEAQGAAGFEDLLHASRQGVTLRKAGVKALDAHGSGLMN